MSSSWVELPTTNQDENASSSCDEVDASVFEVEFAYVKPRRKSQSQSSSAGKFRKQPVFVYGATEC